MKNLSKGLLQLLLVFALAFACETNNPEPSPEEVKIQQLKDDAKFNNSITPGVGNVFYEELLVPNTASQLVFKLAYNQDTLAAYGKINGDGQLEYVHTTLLATKGNEEILVTEIFPDISVNRMYTLVNGVKSSIVAEIQYYSKTKIVISIYDMNWETGEEKVLTRTYINDNVKVSDYSGLRINDKGPVWDCYSPRPSKDYEKEMENSMRYMACVGHGYELHPTLNSIREAFASAANAIRNSDQYADKLQELNFLTSTRERLSRIYEAIEGKIVNYKFERTRMAGLLKALEEKINKIKKSQYDALLEPFEAGTDVDYDEYTDKEVKITFTVIDLATGKPYVKEPVLVDMELLMPGAETAFAENTLDSSPVNGMVTFRFDPLEFEGIKKYSSIIARYSFTKNNWVPYASKKINLKFIDPILSEVSGNNQKGMPGKKLKNPLLVLVTDDLGRVLPKIAVQWEVIEGNGLLISDSETNSEGIAEAEWTLGNDNGDQKISATVKNMYGYKVKPVIFSADLNRCGPTADSTLLFVTDGSWKASHDYTSGWEKLDFYDKNWGSAVFPPYDCITEKCVEASCIWGPEENPTVYLRKTFEVNFDTSPYCMYKLICASDDNHGLSINGKVVYTNDGDRYAGPVVTTDITPYLNDGVNVISVMASDASSNCAAFHGKVFGYKN